MYERSRAGKKASKKKKYVHIAGSKSYAQHAFDMVITKLVLGNSLCILLTFICIH